MPKRTSFFISMIGYSISTLQSDPTTQYQFISTRVPVSNGTLSLHSPPPNLDIVARTVGLQFAVNFELILDQQKAMHKMTTFLWTEQWLQDCNLHDNTQHFPLTMLSSFQNECLYSSFQKQVDRVHPTQFLQ